MAERQRRPLRGELELTQYGSTSGGKPAFRNCPREQDGDGVSLIMGRVTAEEASLLVRGRPSFDKASDRVRYTSVVRLRAAGFRVRHTPSQRNPRHVSVSRPGIWSSDVCGAFDMCFDDGDQGRDVDDV
jgi:predicted fused transcriptional regulator/phosphomethylpyrimidine kinase